jgi:long-chain acyl-CoA synthetase
MVHSLLQRSAQVDPDKTALVCGSRRLSYRDLDETANRFAAGLHAAGLVRGDRVVIYLENSVEAVISIFAVLKAGGAIVPIGRTVKADKLAHILNDCEPTVIVADQRASQVVNDALTRADSVKAVVIVGASPEVRYPAGRMGVSFDDLLAAHPATADPRVGEGIDIDLAALVYTSGSSGRPKGVMLTHANILAATASINGYLRNTADDVILNVLPLSFDYGLYQVFLAFASGARLILERTFGYPAVLLDLVIRESVTGLPIVPTLAALLVRHEMDGYDLSSLRYITNTGAALPPAHIEILRQRLPGVLIFSMYGLTECKRVSYLAPEEIDRRPTSVGKPMDNVEVFVTDAQGQLSATGIGELVIRGANVMQGYWRAPEETARVLKAGFFPGQQLLFSGDEFRIDSDGYMYFQGRLDDVIKSRGQRVSPKEVENVLYELTGVTGAAVVGLEDPVLGSAVKAFLTVDPAITLVEHEVLRHCAQRLEDFMVPKVVEFVATLPTTDSGKIMRRSLQDNCGSSQSSQPS